jgi:predicted DNA-binding transcriptional regulator AlpA
MIMITFEPLLGIKELSEQIGINKFTIYKKIQNNTFPKGVKVNGRRMFKPEQIKSYYKELGIEIEFR